MEWPFRAQPWRCQLEGKGFLLRGNRIVAYAPVLSDDVLFDLIYRNYNSYDEYELMVDTAIGVFWFRGTLFTREDIDATYMLGINELQYGLMLLALHGLLELREKCRIVCTAFHLIAEELREKISEHLDKPMKLRVKEMMERLERRPNTAVERLESEYYPKLWHLVRDYYKKGITHKDVDPVVDEVLELVSQCTDLEHEVVERLRSNKGPVVGRLLNTIGLVESCIDHSVKGETRREAVDYLRKVIPKNELVKRGSELSESERRIVEMCVKGAVSAVLGLWEGYMNCLEYRVEDPVKGYTEDPRIWCYQTKAYLMKLRDLGYDEFLKKYYVEELEMFSDPEVWLIEYTSRRSGVREVTEDDFYRQYYYEIEAVENDMERGLRLLREYRTGLVPEVERELVLREALKYIRRARMRLKELIDVTARLGLMRLHKKYRESWENTEWIKKELKKIIEELEYDYSSP